MCTTSHPRTNANINKTCNQPVETLFSPSSIIYAIKIILHTGMGWVFRDVLGHELWLGWAELRLCWG